MSFLVLCNEALKGVYWSNKCSRVGKLRGFYPLLTDISERARIHALIDTNMRKSLVYVLPRQ